MSRRELLSLGANEDTETTTIADDTATNVPPPVREEVFHR